MNQPKLLTTGTEEKVNEKKEPQVVAVVTSIAIAASRYAQRIRCLG
jgi:hypothetical protein